MFNQTYCPSITCLVLEHCPMEHITHPFYQTATTTKRNTTTKGPQLPNDHHYQRTTTTKGPQLPKDHHYQRTTTTKGPPLPMDHNYQRTTTIKGPPLTKDQHYQRTTTTKGPQLPKDHNYQRTTTTKGPPPVCQMKSVLVIILITVLTGVQSSSKNCSRVVCYFLQNAYGFMSPRHVQPDLCTHIVISGISISKISDLNSSRTHWNTNPITGLVKLKKKSDVKILIAIQSSSLSDGFVVMYSSPVERKIFIAALVRILRKRNLDGVKIDEQLYPGNKGKFSDFISEIYCEFLKVARESEKTNLILSVGIPVDIPFLEENYDIYSLSDNSDMLDVASYYFKVPNITDNPQHHSPLRSKDHTSTRSIVYVLDYIVTQGCKLDKINVGLSTMCFYYSLTHPGTYSLTDIRGYDMIEYIVKNNYGGVVIKALNYDDYSTGYCDGGKLFPLMKAVKKACGL
ncbi:hypothetical protein Btru_033484 [Bulinus truncatus]|nr:hypothetical protein Btru_033484 [Bulinus truncatus]